LMELRERLGDVRLLYLPYTMKRGEPTEKRAGVVEDG